MKEFPESFGHERFTNRELSRLEFGSRLLDLAVDDHLPVLERCKFVAIFAEMIDEFFQVRVVSLEDKIAAGVESKSVDGLRPKEQIRAIRERVIELIVRQDRIVLDLVVPELEASGIKIIRNTPDHADTRRELSSYFESQIFPVLTPLAVDPGHPFPMISNLSLNIVVSVTDSTNGERRLARVKVPDSLPRFVPVGANGDLCLLEDVISMHLHLLFPGMDIGEPGFCRVTRNADLAFEEDEADDLMVALETELRRRRFGRALRLELTRGFPSHLRDLLTEQLDLESSQIYVSDAPLGLGSLWDLWKLDRPDLKNESWTPVTPVRLVPVKDGPVDIFEEIRRGDLLVHHPYESFSDSVELFIDQASRDPDVVAIKQTLYRTGGNSPIVASLIRAAGLGKQVAALVELKARFDEAANIEWAKALEDAGVHVVYGVVGLKTHSKTSLVIRNEKGTIRRYAHVGTGNYNSRTARSYEDFGLLTCAEDLTSEIGELFNFLTGYSKMPHGSSLISSPIDTRRAILDFIEEQTALGVDGKIVIKVNGLTDPRIIDSLYRASAEGVCVQLIVRGLCCIRPGVEGLSENIHVRSIVGDFLEHSRIFIFGTATTGSERVYIGSADLMERNLDRRVEVLVPIRSDAGRSEIFNYVELLLADDRNAWSLGTDRRWRRVSTLTGISAQRETMKRFLHASVSVDF